MAVRISECRHCFGMNSQSVSAHRIEEYEESSTVYTFGWCAAIFFLTTRKCSSNLYVYFYCFTGNIFCRLIVTFKFIAVVIYVSFLPDLLSNSVINFRFSSHLQMIIFGFCFTFYGCAIVTGEKFVNNLSKRYAIAIQRVAAHIHICR